MIIQRLLLFSTTFFPALSAQEAGPKIIFKLVNFPPAYTAKLHLKAIHEVADIRIMQKNGRTSPTEDDLVSSQIATSDFREELQQGVQDLANYTPTFKKPISSTKMPYLSSINLKGTLSMSKKNKITSTLSFPFLVIYRGQREVSFSIQFKEETAKGINYTVLRDEAAGSPATASTFTGQVQMTTPR